MVRSVRFNTKTFQGSIVLAAIMLLLASSLLSGSGTIALAQTNPETVPVSIVPGASSLTTTAFSPNPVNIKVGDSVKWTNNDNQTHTVTSGEGLSDPKKGALFDSSPNFAPTLPPNGTFTHTFNQAGEFHYFCQLHPTMTGIVNVAAFASSPIRLHGDSTSGNFRADIVWIPNNLGAVNKFYIKILDDRWRNLVNATYDTTLLEGTVPLNGTARFGQQSSEQDFVFSHQGSYAIIISNINGAGTVDTINVPVQVRPVEGVTGILVHTVKPNYIAGETVIVEGGILGTAHGQSISLQTYSPNGVKYLDTLVQVSDDGSFAYDFTIEGKYAINGDDKVVASYNGFSNVTAFHFTSISPPPMHSVKQYKENLKFFAFGKAGSGLTKIYLKAPRKADALVYGIAIAIPTDRGIDSFQAQTGWSGGILGNTIIFSTSNNPMTAGEWGAFRITASPLQTITTPLPMLQYVEWACFDTSSNHIDDGIGRVRD